MTTGCKSVALTFDAGWGQAGASEIIEILRETALRVTLFLTGRFIRQYPDLVRRMAEDRHEIGNHTDTHSHLISRTGGGTTERDARTALHQELWLAERTFQHVTGCRMSPLWRAPYGRYNADLLRYALELGYRHADWTLDTRDWVSDPAMVGYRTANQIRDDVLRRARDGDVILMHLHTARPLDRPWEELREIISGLRQRSFDLVTASELFERHAQRWALLPSWRRRARSLSARLTDERERLLRFLSLRGHQP